MRLPNWTVRYNIVSPENKHWIGTGWEFFDIKDDADACYKRHQELRNCPSRRPFHKNDIPHLGAVHRMKM